MKFTMKKPCPECPFRKTSIPGWLADHTPQDLLTVVRMDGAWPCHKTHKGGAFDDLRGDPDVQHCAGAAIFARHICKMSRDSEVGAHQRAVEPSDDVFRNDGEFLEHHTMFR